MYDEFSEQNISGLNEKIMDIVKSLKGDQTESEILSQIILQTRTLFATYKVRELFMNNLELASVPIVDASTGKVAEDMELLANAISVVRVQSIDNGDDGHTVAVLNVGLKDKTYQIMTVFDRLIQAVDEDGKFLNEEDLENLEKPPVEVYHIQYLLRLGVVGEELKNVVTFEFTHEIIDDDCGCCNSESEEDCHCHNHNEHEHKEDDGDKDEDEDEDEDEDDNEGEEELIKLDFDMDVMDQFTKDCNVSISSEDLLLYLVSMEFISFYNELSELFLNCSGRKTGRSMSVWRISSWMPKVRCYLFVQQSHYSCFRRITTSDFSPVSMGSAEHRVISFS